MKLHNTAVSIMPPEKEIGSIWFNRIVPPKDGDNVGVPGCRSRGMGSVPGVAGFSE
jgi:hypothetical protein